MHVVAIVNSMRGVYQCINIISRSHFEYVHTGGIARLYGNSVFNFLNNCHAVYHRGYIILHSH